MSINTQAPAIMGDASFGMPKPGLDSLPFAVRNPKKAVIDVKSGTCVETSAPMSAPVLLG
jgi:hypothetical protein